MNDGQKMETKLGAYKKNRYRCAVKQDIATKKACKWSSGLQYWNGSR